MRALVKYQVRPVRRHSPTLADVRELAEQLKVIDIKDATGLLCIRQHVDLAVQGSNALAKFVAWQIPFLDHLTRLELDLSKTRATFLACTFVEKAVVKKEAFSKRFRVVRIGFDDLIAVNGEGGLRRRAGISFRDICVCISRA